MFKDALQVGSIVELGNRLEVKEVVIGSLIVTITNTLLGNDSELLWSKNPNSENNPINYWSRIENNEFIRVGGVVYLAHDTEYEAQRVTITESTVNTASSGDIIDTNQNGITDDADKVNGHEVELDIGKIPVSTLEARDDIYNIKQELGI